MLYTPTSNTVLKRLRYEVMQHSIPHPAWYMLNTITISMPVIEVTKETIKKVYDWTLVILNYTLGAGYKGKDKRYSIQRAFIFMPDKKWKECTSEGLDCIPEETDEFRKHWIFDPWDNPIAKFTS